MQDEMVVLTRDCEAAMVPAGTLVLLQKGERAYITQALGGSYTVVVNGNMFRIAGKDADVLGIAGGAAETPARSAPTTQEEVEDRVWEQLKTCYDPEIPVDIVELGLIYGCDITKEDGGWRVDIKMTLTAAGCGMGEHLTQEVRTKLLSIEGVKDAKVELVWDPPWSQEHMSEAARLELGIFY